MNVRGCQVLMFYLAVCQTNAIDKNARAHIDRVKQQLRLLAMSIDEGKKASNSNANSSRPNAQPLDARVSYDKSLTVVVGGLPIASSELQCTQ